MNIKHFSWSVFLCVMKTVLFLSFAGCGAEQVRPFRAIAYLSLGDTCEETAQCQNGLVCKPIDTQTNHCVNPTLYNPDRETQVLAARQVNWVSCPQDDECRKSLPAPIPPLRSGTDSD